MSKKFMTRQNVFEMLKKLTEEYYVDLIELTIEGNEVVIAFEM